MSDLIGFTREFLKFDEAFLFLNTFLWLAYPFWDMKHAGMVQKSWMELLLWTIGATFVLGPGAAAGLGWLWR